MNNECSVVRDLLPLYYENMVNKETAEFVEEHLGNCPDCASELEKLRAEKTIGETSLAERTSDAEVITGMKKKIRKKKWTAVTVIVACILIFSLLIYQFPVYRLLIVAGTLSYYDSDEISMLVSIGSLSDRIEAQSVLRQADAAFQDCKHTDAECDELYGILSRYATPSERSASYVKYSLELWSAHLDDTEGYIWVYYSMKAINSDGDTVSASSRCEALWKVEKNEDGVWEVVSIREHP
ncbi:MAG: zf-HC2 domain-containing protein [Oscillospiraceae bacterium]|nr:zf-HC2 domain-containing protein [Oscillospiraceae bacterium]